MSVKKVRNEDSGAFVINSPIFENQDDCELTADIELLKKKLKGKMSAELSE
jgi:hypothetical protein